MQAIFLWYIDYAHLQLDLIIIALPGLVTAPLGRANLHNQVGADGST